MTRATFDPAFQRRVILEVALPYGGTFDPRGVKPSMVSQKLDLTVDVLLQCYWVGLVAEATPRLAAIVDWMEQHRPPERTFYDQDLRGRLACDYDHYCWWRTLGLAKWLLDREAGTVELEKAVNVVMESWRQSLPDHIGPWREANQFNLSQRLAVALGAGKPSEGLHLIREVGAYRTRPPERPVLKFGRWGCEYLASGQPRDAVFIEQGAAMLKVSTMGNFFLEPGGRTDPALWLKAIFFDRRHPVAAL